VANCLVQNEQETEPNKTMHLRIENASSHKNFPETIYSLSLSTNNFKINIQCPPKVLEQNENIFL